MFDPGGHLIAFARQDVGNESGEPIGAVGITGDTSDNDEACAYAGIAAAGLSAQG